MVGLGGRRNHASPRHRRTITPQDKILRRGTLTAERFSPKLHIWRLPCPGKKFGPPCVLNRELTSSRLLVHSRTPCVFRSKYELALLPYSCPGFEFTGTGSMALV